MRENAKLTKEIKNLSASINTFDMIADCFFSDGGRDKYDEINYNTFKLAADAILIVRKNLHEAYENILKC